jgi:hypothetical protein
MHLRSICLAGIASFGRRPTVNETRMGSDAAATCQSCLWNLGEFNERGALLIIICHGIDPATHGKRPHQSSIAGLEQVGHRSHTLTLGSSQRS